MDVQDKLATYRQFLRLLQAQLMFWFATGMFAGRPPFWYIAGAGFVLTLGSVAYYLYQLRRLANE